MALYRSTDDKVLAGVCGGIAHALGWNATFVRLAYVLLSMCSATFPGILVYLVLWLVTPEDSQRVAA